MLVPAIFIVALKSLLLIITVNSLPELDKLQALPGIGRSTAGAILASHFHQRAAILDGNVKRVLTRVHALAGWPGQTVVAKQLWEMAEHYTPTQHIADYTQAIMDLGATVCNRSRPRCSLCPLQEICQAYQLDQQTDFPHRKPRKTLPVRSCYLLLLHNAKQEVLLEKRPPTGIWGGLWCLPECSLDHDLKTFCTKRYGLTIKQQQILSSFRHTFSHYHLDIHPVKCLVSPRKRQIMDSSHLIWL